MKLYQIIANELLISQLNGSNFTAWYAEVLVARISQEIEYFWPAPGLNPYPSDI